MQINTTCEFEGSGTYEGNLNGHEFKLKKVLYIKVKINKNLISWKQINKGRNKSTKITPRKDNGCLILKYNNKKQKNKLLGSFESDEK